MESIGGKLKATREEKGYSLEQVARETHIAKRFLEAMEAEDFSAFPGEPYLIGFLRTYASYLSLDPQEMVSLYHNLKLQEQPAPIDELLDKRSRRPLPPWGIAVIVGGLAVVAVAVLYFTGIISFGSGSNDQEPEVVQPAPQQATGETVTLVDEILERSFTIGDTVLIPVGGATYPVRIRELTDGLVLASPDSELTLAPGEEALLDVDNDQRDDIKILLRSIQSDRDPATVVLRLDRVVQSPSGTVTDPAPVEAPPETAPVGTTNVASRRRQTTVIGEFQQREEQFLELEFRGYSLVRHTIDSNDTVEQYFQSGDVFRTSFRNLVVLGISNAGAVRARVAGRDLDLGDPGEVVAWQIRWVTSGDNRVARLELIPMY